MQFGAAGFHSLYFLRGETRPHVHVTGEHGEVQFWLAPRIQLAHSVRLGDRQVRLAEALIRAHEQAILREWHEHFGS